MFSRLVMIAKAMKYRDHRYCHVAFIVKGNGIKSIGVNKRKTNPISLRHPYKGGEHSNTHAELDAMIKYPKSSYKDHTLVLVMIRRNGKLGLSKPCPGCTSLLSTKDFKKVYYSTESQEFELLG